MCYIERTEPRTLALTEGLGSITICGCGTVSLHLGCVSVRLELDAFTQASAMCQAAMESLRQDIKLQPELEAVTILH
jgi:hypothetical protein